MFCVMLGYLFGLFWLLLDGWVLVCLDLLVYVSVGIAVVWFIGLGI